MTEGIGVALNALRSDASTWKKAAGDLQSPVSALGSLTIKPADVSMYGVDAGIDKTYEEARTALTDMLRQASDYFQKLGRDLDSAAGQYERDDQKGMHDLQRSAE